MAADELEPRLRALVRQEILALEADARSAERGQYAFVQALIREVAYNTLSRIDRKAKHLAVARIFEALPTDELAGALAGHYVAAHANAPDGPEADALAAQARIALRGAADRAAALGSHDQALGYLVQAEAITTDPTQRAALWETAGREADHAGHLEVARGYFERLVAVRRAGPDRSAAATAVAELGGILLNAGRVGEALELIGRPSTEFGPDEAPEGLAYLVGELARAYMRSGRDHEAIEAADRALPIAERFELFEPLAESLNTKGTSLTSIGRMQEGIVLLRGALAISEAHGLVSIGAPRPPEPLVLGHRRPDPGDRGRAPRAREGPPARAPRVDLRPDLRHRPGTRVDGGRMGLGRGTPGRAGGRGVSVRARPGLPRALLASFAAMHADPEQTG